MEKSSQVFFLCFFRVLGTPCEDCEDFQRFLIRYLFFLEGDHPHIFKNYRKAGTSLARLAVLAKPKDFSRLLVSEDSQDPRKSSHLHPRGEPPCRQRGGWGMLLVPSEESDMPTPFTPQELLTLRYASHREALAGGRGVIWISEADAQRALEGAGEAFRASDAWSITRGPGNADGQHPMELRAWVLVLDVLQDQASLITMHRDTWLELERAQRETWAALNRPGERATQAVSERAWPDLAGSFAPIVNPDGLVSDS